jgi:hypothetical protein
MRISLGTPVGAVGGVGPGDGVGAVGGVGPLGANIVIAIAATTTTTITAIMVTMAVVLVIAFKDMKPLPSYLCEEDEKFIKFTVAPGRGIRFIERA